MKRLRPEVLVVDITVPELNRIDTTRRVTAELPGIKVIALSMNSNRRYVIAMLEAGATGYLLKNSASDELLNALDRVSRPDVLESGDRRKRGRAGGRESAIVAPKGRESVQCQGA